MRARRFSRQSPLAALVLAACVPRASVPPPPVATRTAPPRPATMRPPTLREAMLAVHARERARVGLPPLAWDDRLAADARGWAVALARSGRFRHAAQEEEGENLWAGTRGAFGYASMADDWAAERRGRWGITGHYTQIVWRATARLGCGLASNAREDVLVCRYWPPGNVEGERAY